MIKNSGQQIISSDTLFTLYLYILNIDNYIKVLKLCFFY